MRRAALLALLLGATWVVAAPAPLTKADRKPVTTARTDEFPRTCLLDSVEVGALPLLPAVPPPPLPPPLLPRPIAAESQNADPPLND